MIENLKEVSNLKLLSCSLVASVALSACGNRGPQLQDGVPGKIVDKTFVEGELEYNASLQMWLPEPNKYTLHIRQCGFEDRPEQDEEDCIVIDKSVRRNTYDKYTEGDTIVFGG
jgi:hypothetical protein